MEIICIGLSHHTAPVELRERLTYSPEALRAALARFGCGLGQQPINLTELAILSTCNRLEVYAAGHTDQVEELIKFVSETTGVPAAEFAAQLYQYTHAAVAQHLSRVASGLDSMILGEPQILGQVTDAYGLALSQQSIGPVLSALFRSAIHTGKRARTETGISRNPASISSVAVKLAESIVPNLSSACVVIVGAGEMAELAVEALRQRGAQNIVVVNRTHDRAIELTDRWNATALTFERLPEALIDADIVISSTGAPHIVIKPPMVEAAMRQRPDRPLVLIDIAVPRDIDPEVNKIPRVHSYDIDDLESRLNGSIAQRALEVPQVEAIITEETTGFMNWLDSLDMLAVIADLHHKADLIRHAEIEKTLRYLKHLDENDRRHIELLTESLVNKLLHEPTMRLKAEAGNGHAAEYATAVRHLFALNQQSHFLDVEAP